MKQRIHKILADTGIESRRHIEEMILQGRVTVNGKIATRLPVMVDAEQDQVQIDGEHVPLSRPTGEDRVYIIMHKPPGVVCTNVAQGEQQCAIDLLPPGFSRRVYPVGRLDADSRGLLLLTNDGELTQKLTHPKFGVAKTYTASVDGYIKPEVVEQLAAGIWLADPQNGGFKTGQSRIKVIRRSPKRSVLQITIHEGRNRQIRRMLAKFGHKVRELTRTKIGPLELGSLKAGESRLITTKELNSLRRAVQIKQQDGVTATKQPPKKEASKLIRIRSR